MVRVWLVHENGIALVVIKWLADGFCSQGNGCLKAGARGGKEKERNFKSFEDILGY